jgi:hypothetical protein
MDMKKLYFLVFFLLSACLKDAADAELPARTQYTLTITAGEGGSVSPEATGTYDAGATVTISATPDAGYEFDRWQGSDFDNSGCAFALYCRTAITINSNRDVQAFFKSQSE